MKYKFTLLGIILLIASKLFAQAQTANTAAKTDKTGIPASQQHSVSTSSQPIPEANQHNTQTSGTQNDSPEIITLNTFVTARRGKHILKMWNAARSRDSQINSEPTTIFRRTHEIFGKRNFNPKQISPQWRIFLSKCTYWDKLLIYFTDDKNKIMSLSKVCLDSIYMFDLSNKNTIIYKIKVTDDTLCVLDLEKLLTVNIHDTIKVELLFLNQDPSKKNKDINTPCSNYRFASTINGNMRFFRTRTQFNFYNAISNLPGIWFPTAMFATNFKTSSNGITFAPMPIGAAFGVKLNMGKGYLGFSGIASWLIYSQPSGGSTNNSGFNLQGITFGGLLDINNYITIGYCYALNTIDHTKNPGGSLVIGVAPAILSLLKGSPTTSSTKNP